MGAVQRGLFMLIADGFDEVERSQVGTRRREILEFAEKFKESPLIVTSRADREFTGWGGFTELKVAPFTLEKIRLLVAKLNSMKDKIRFLTAVETTLYKTHGVFPIESPLLTIMLLTYSQNASVPTKNHLFYGRVFDLLCSQHDAPEGRVQAGPFHRASEFRISLPCYTASPPSHISIIRCHSIVPRH